MHPIKILFPLFFIVTSFMVALGGEVGQLIATALLWMVCIILLISVCMAWTALDNGKPTDFKVPAKVHIPFDVFRWIYASCCIITVAYTGVWYNYLLAGVILLTFVYAEAIYYRMRKAGGVYVK